MKLLVPVDFEEASLEALRLATDFAKPLGAVVVLVHVYHLPVYSYPELSPTVVLDLHESVAAAARRSLDALAAKWGGLPTILRGGDAVAEILEAIDSTGADMVVMGTHGRKLLARLFLGSVAERVVRRSPVPVLTVRPAEPASQPVAP